MSVRLLFFFNDTATTEIYTLSLHDALPISRLGGQRAGGRGPPARPGRRCADHRPPRRGAAPDRPRQAGGLTPLPRFSAETQDRKSTRLNSSHANISYAVFCLKKKT